MGKNPTNEEILESIKESGYLLEQEIATILEQNEFHVETNKSFEDLDTKKSREIDVFAIKRIHYDEDKKINIFVNFLCECKNNTNPFVFIGRNKNIKDDKLNPQEFSFPFKQYHKVTKREGTSKTYQHISPINHFSLKDKYLFSQSNLKYVQFSKIVRHGKTWRANHEGIFDSILIPMIKALLHYKKNHKVKTGDWTNIFLHFPIVVLNSDLLKIDSTQKDYTIESEKFLPVMREIDSNNIKGTFVIDFTNKSNFQSYIDNQISLANKIKDIAENNLDFLLKQEFDAIE